MGGGVGGDQGAGHAALKNYKMLGFLAILVRILWKSQSYQASIQC